MTRSGSFPDGVRVADADDRDFRSCAGEQRQEDPHGAFLCTGGAAHVRVRGGCFVWGRGRVSRVRAARTARHGRCRSRVSAAKLGSTAACGFCKPVRFREASPRKSRPGARRDRVRWPLDSTTAMQEQSIWGCSPTLFQVAVAPGGHAARASARRCPPLDARATAPSGGIFSEVKAHSLLPLQGCPRRGLSSKLEAHALTSRRHTLPRGLLPPWWRPPRSSTSGIGSRPTSTC